MPMPDDVTAFIVSLLEPSAISSARLVCRAWADAFPRCCRSLSSRPRQPVETWGRTGGRKFTNLDRLKVFVGPAETTGCTALASLSSPGALVGLRSLAYNAPTITGADSAVLQELASLEELQLGSTRSPAPDVSFLAEPLGRLASLQSLCLSRLRGVDTILASICCLPRLTSLELRYCQRLTDGALHSIGRALPALTALDLSGSGGVTQEGIRSLAHLGALRDLSLIACGGDGLLDDNGRLGHLTELTSLTRLDLSQNNSLTSLRGVGALARLQDLALEGCRGLRGCKVARLKGLSELRRLEIAGCPLVNRCDVLRAVSGLRCLQALSCRFFFRRETRESVVLLKRFFASAESLACLSVPFGADLAPFVEHGVALPHVVELTIGPALGGGGPAAWGGGEQVDDYCLRAYLSLQAPLRVLRLHELRVTQAGLQEAIQQHPRLAELSLHMCPSTLDAAAISRSHVNRPRVHRCGPARDRRWVELLQACRIEPK